MKAWLPDAIAALLCWGLWAFFPKLSLQRISPASSVFFEGCGVMITSMAVVLLLGPRIELDWEGGLFAMLTGMFGTIGLYFFFRAVKCGQVAVISSLTALYPVVTVFLAFFLLHEPIGLRKIAGIVFALAAAGLLAYD